MKIVITGLLLVFYSNCLMSESVPMPGFDNAPAPQPMPMPEFDNIPAPQSPLSQGGGISVAGSSGASLYKTNSTCPFYVDTGAFAEQIGGVNKYLADTQNNDKKCSQKLDLGDPTTGVGGFMQAMRDYKSLMGAGGMNSGFGGGPEINCFNVDEFYKNKAEMYLIAFNSKTPTSLMPVFDMNSFGDSGGVSLNPKSFSICDNKPKSEVNDCLAEVRVYNVSLKKKSCEHDENYAKDKAKLELSLNAIQTARGTILNIISAPECRDRLPGNIVSSLVTLGASAAAMAAPGLGGVAAGAAADIINTAIRLYTTDGTAKKLLENQKDEERFQSLACLYVDFKNKYYNCNGDGDEYLKSLEELQQKNSGNAPLSNWVSMLNKNKENLQSLKLIDGGPNYPDFIKAAQGLDCLGNLSSSSANYGSVMSATSCMNNKIGRNRALIEAIPAQDKIKEMRNLPGSIVDGTFSEENIQSLLALRNDSNISSIKCTLDNFPQSAEDFQLVILNGDVGDKKDPDYIKKNEVVKTLNNFLNCLTVKRPKESIEGKNIYKDLLRGEAEYHAMYDAPINAARQSILAGELSPNLKNALDNSFKSLIVNLKNDKVFTEQINIYAEKLKKGIKSSIEQEGEDPMDAVFPLFNACLQLNPLRYKNDNSKDGLSTYDAGTITSTPVNTGRRRLLKKDVPDNDYPACNMLSCVLPKPNWTDDAKDKVSKYKEMACNSSKGEGMYKSDLEIRLERLKQDKKLQLSSPSAETYLSRICNSEISNKDNFNEDAVENISK